MSIATAAAQAAKNNTVIFTNLGHGRWGIIGPADVITEGQPVTVTKKSGATSTVIVDRIISPEGAFDGTVAIATFTDPNAKPKPTCAECGRTTTTLIEVEDLSGITGMVCRRCAATAPYGVCFG